MNLSKKRFQKLGALACVAIGALALTGCDRNDLAPTSLSIAADQADYIGHGIAKSLAAPHDEVTATGTGADVRLHVKNPKDVSEWWDAEIAAPIGQTLHVGTYTGAERAAFRTGTAPGLDISGSGRGCNKVTGDFVIYEIKTDGAGNIVQLDADAHQHCEGAAAVLNAALRFNAVPMNFILKSDTGDYVGQGMSKTYDGSTSTFGMQAYGAGGINYSVSGLGDTWRAIITPPTGTQLTAGSTYSTTRFSDATHAGLDFFGDGRGCNTSSGSLTINVITRDGSGTVTALNATFVQHCENKTPALTGAIRYNA